MPLIRLRDRAQITLPQDVRDALRVKEGDYLEAELRDDGVLLRAVDVSSRADATTRLAGLLGVPTRYRGPVPHASDDEVMAEALEAIEEDRREAREGGPR